MAIARSSGHGDAVPVERVTTEKVPLFVPRGSLQGLHPDGTGCFDTTWPHKAGVCLQGCFSGLVACGWPAPLGGRAAGSRLERALGNPSFHAGVFTGQALRVVSFRKGKLETCQSREIHVRRADTIFLPRPRRLSRLWR